MSSLWYKEKNGMEFITESVFPCGSAQARYQRHAIYTSSVQAAALSPHRAQTQAGMRVGTVVATQIGHCKQHYHWPHFLKEWKTPGKVSNKTKNNLPSNYMVVTFLETSTNTLYFICNPGTGSR